jgi:hypothetical protein
VAFTALGTVPADVDAGAVSPFDPQAFAAAQAAGDGIVVFVHAPW